MGLIKSNNAPATLSTFSMSDIESEAHAIIARAKNQASRILVEAQRVGEELKAQAREEGRSDGRAEGLKAGSEQGHAAGHAQALAEQREALSQLLSTLSVTCSELDSSRRLLESQAGNDVMRLAVAIARRVTRRLGEIDHAVVADNLRGAMRLAVRASDIRIAVNPAQKQSLEATLPQLQIQFPELAHIAIVDDATITPGGCRIFAGSGQIDADLDEQVSRIAADLLPEK